MLLKCLWVSNVLYIGLLRPATFLQVIMKLLDKCLKIPATLPNAIVEVVDIGQVLPATLNLVIMEDMLIEVYLGHRSINNKLRLTSTNISHEPGGP